MNATPNTVIVRYAPEMMLKATRARRRLEKLLKQNLREAFARRDLPVSLSESDRGGRLMARVPEGERGLGPLKRVFGVGSFSPVAATCASDLEEICRVGGETFTDQVAGKRYAVRARRLAKVGFSSVVVERALGAALNGPGRVDLTNPDITVRAEIHGETTYLFSDKIPGARGLPMGSQERAITLFSGGFDSAVAAWRVMKRGVATDFLLCNLGGAAYERMVLQVAKVLSELWVYGHRPKLYVVDFAEPVAEMRDTVDGRYWQVILKRMMYRAAAAVAEETDARAIVTGESVGQVSSQTLSNLNAIEGAAGDLPVLRPLIGFDKLEIIDAAREIGTAPLSERVREFCGLSEQKPIVDARPQRTEREEAKMDLSILERAVAGRKATDVLRVTAKDLRQPYLFVEDLPEGALVIDCQTEGFYRAWHVPGARHVEPDDLMKSFRQFDKDKTYVLYCTWDMQSPMLAEMMQQYGFDAYAFKGGIGKLRRLVEGESASASQDLGDVPA